MIGRLRFPRTGKDAARIISLYFIHGGAERRLALLSVILFFIGGFVVVWLNVWINQTNGALFNALQARDVTKFYHAFYSLAGEVILLLGIMLGRMVIIQLLELRWRRWLTAHFIGLWTKDNAFYHMRFQKQHVGEKNDNPDQRIAEDVKELISKTAALAQTLFDSLVTLFSFTGILWALSGTIEIPLWYDVSAQSFTMWTKIPGYLVWVILIYQIIISLGAVKIGRPLIGLDKKQQSSEADFRLGLMRLKENAEPIALLQGGEKEYDYALARFNDLYVVAYKLIIVNARYFSYSFINGQTASYLPYLAAAPRYFAGDLTLGDLMQILGAFAHVAGALSWVMGTFPMIAQWQATLERLLEFECAVTANGIEACFSAKVEKEIAFEPGFSVLNSSGENLLTFMRGLGSFKLTARENILVSGASGAGKSAFLKTCAGLWPYTSGQVKRPAKDRIFFLPQDPYMPPGRSLREMLYYPRSPPSEQSAILKETDVLCGLDLAHLAALLDLPRADAGADRNRRLSPGEMQRISLARAILHRPEWLFLDDAFSQLNVEQCERACALLSTELPETAMVCAGPVSLAQLLKIKRIFTIMRAEQSREGILMEVATKSFSIERVAG